jgi:hypothetical protein
VPASNGHYDCCSEILNAALSIALLKALDLNCPQLPPCFWFGFQNRK